MAAGKQQNSAGRAEVSPSIGLLAMWLTALAAVRRRFGAA
jgi:hypothetical protein